MKISRLTRKLKNGVHYYYSLVLDNSHYSIKIFKTGDVWLYYEFDKLFPNKFNMMYAIPMRTNTRKEMKNNFVRKCIELEGNQK